MQHLVLVDDFLHRQRHRARVGAEDRVDLVVQDQGFRLACADVRLGLGVAVHHLDLVLAEQPAALVELRDRTGRPLMQCAM
jgi:hypothetical protein